MIFPTATFTIFFLVVMPLSWLTMPHVRLSVLGSLFFLIGGGIPVAMNSLHAMASDISSEADRY